MCPPYEQWASGRRRAAKARVRHLGWLRGAPVYRRSLLAQELKCMRRMGERGCALSHAPSRRGHEGAAPIGGWLSKDGARD